MLFFSRLKNVDGRRPLAVGFQSQNTSTEETMKTEAQTRRELIDLKLRLAGWDVNYHLYQGILIVNNGQFGGSNFYAPFKEHYHRQVLHLHGQPQTQIAFIEVDPKKFICRPSDINLLPKGEWKSPPAGWGDTCPGR